MDSPVFVDSPVAASDCRFPRRHLFEDSCCARRAVDKAHNLLAYVTIRPGVVAEAGAGSN